MHRAERRLATRYVVRGPRSELSGATRGLEFHLSLRCRHSGGAAGGYEWIQVSAASLDEGFSPDVQEVVAECLAEPATLSNKSGSHRAFDVEFRLPAAGNAVRPFISFHWWTSGWLGSHSAGRHSDFSRGIGVGWAFLHLCPTRVASPNMDQRDPFSAMFACTRNRSLAQQRAGSARSDG